MPLRSQGRCVQALCGEVEKKYETITAAALLDDFVAVAVVVVVVDDDDDDDAGAAAAAAAAVASGSVFYIQLSIYSSICFFHFPTQYSALLLSALLAELFLLGCAYFGGPSLDEAFHDGLGRGLVNIMRYAHIYFPRKKMSNSIFAGGVREGAGRHRSSGRHAGSRKHSCLSERLQKSRINVFFPPKHFSPLCPAAA